MKINKAVIATEPKAHLSFVELFLGKGVSLLMDKPITAPIGLSSSYEAAKKVYQDYLKIKKMLEGSNVKFVIQCQRRNHPGYIFIKSYLNKIIEDYQLPITYMDIYHSDGSWYMPNEFDNREDHPFKYGYGKLMHSGYHFVDIFAWLQESNKHSKSYNPDRIKVYSQSQDVSDMLNVIDKDIYKKLFSSNKLDSFFDNYKKKNYNRYGEVDLFSQIQFLDRNNLLTSCTVNLLKSGFSRRAWLDLPEDTYKANGRVRHERLNINIGPILNIQVHSYQAYEIKDRENHNTTNIGDLNHFDVYIFRNSQLIGGKVFEKYNINDFKKYEDDSLGVNEDARLECLKNFLSDKETGSNFIEHELTNYLISLIYLTLVRKHKNKIPYIESKFL